VNCEHETKVYDELYPKNETGSKMM